MANVENRELLGTRRPPVTVGFRGLVGTLGVNIGTSVVDASGLSASGKIGFGNNDRWEQIAAREAGAETGSTTFDIHRSGRISLLGSVYMYTIRLTTDVVDHGQVVPRTTSLTGSGKNAQEVMDALPELIATDQQARGQLERVGVRFPLSDEQFNGILQDRRDLTYEGQIQEQIRIMLDDHEGVPGFIPQYVPPDKDGNQIVRFDLPKTASSPSADGREIEFVFNADDVLIHVNGPRYNNDPKGGVLVEKINQINLQLHDYQSIRLLSQALLAKAKDPESRIDLDQEFYPKVVIPKGDSVSEGELVIVPDSTGTSGVFAVKSTDHKIIHEYSLITARAYMVPDEGGREPTATVVISFADVRDGYKMAKKDPIFIRGIRAGSEEEALRVAPLRLVIRNQVDEFRNWRRGGMSHSLDIASRSSR